MSNVNQEAAFPLVAVREVSSGTKEYFSSGMTLRDYFAGQALGVMKITLELDGKYGVSTGAEGVARYAYLLADAMLKERAK